MLGRLPFEMQLEAHEATCLRADADIAHLRVSSPELVRRFWKPQEWAAVHMMQLRMSQWALNLLPHAEETIAAYMKRAATTNRLGADMSPGRHSENQKGGSRR